MLKLNWVRVHMLLAALSRWGLGSLPSLQGWLLMAYTPCGEMKVVSLLIKIKLRIFSTNTLSIIIPQYGSKVITEKWICHLILEWVRWWSWRTTGSTKWIANQRSTQKANSLNGLTMPVMLTSMMLTSHPSIIPWPKMIMTAAESINLSMKLLN